MSVLEKIKNSGVKVGVLCGGPGGEREVSLASGENTHRALLGAGLTNELLVVPESHPETFLETMECGLAVMMLHGTFGEDGTAQSILERRGIAYTGSGPDACALAMDKERSKKVFVENGIPTPRWVCDADPVVLAKLVEERGLRYPLFAKPNNGGSSVGTHKVASAVELIAAAEEIAQSGVRVLVEEMIVGKELTVGWLAGRTLPIIELMADGEFYDYRAKYVSEKTRYVCPAELAPELAAEVSGHAARVAACLGVRDLSRIDVMVGEDGPMVLELNALPGFTTHSLVPMAAAAMGIKLEDLCLDLAAMAAGRAGIL